MVKVWALYLSCILFSVWFHISADVCDKNSPEFMYEFSCMLTDRTGYSSQWSISMLFIEKLFFSMYLFEILELLRIDGGYIFLSLILRQVFVDSSLQFIPPSIRQHKDRNCKFCLNILILQ